MTLNDDVSSSEGPLFIYTGNHGTKVPDIGFSYLHLKTRTTKDRGSKEKTVSQIRFRGSRVKEKEGEELTLKDPFTLRRRGRGLWW